jgi:hypothetical protein
MVQRWQEDQRAVVPLYQEQLGSQNEKSRGLLGAVAPARSTTLARGNTTVKPDSKDGSVF